MGATVACRVSMASRSILQEFLLDRSARLDPLATVRTAETLQLDAALLSFRLLRRFETEFVRFRRTTRFDHVVERLLAFGFVDAKVRDEDGKNLFDTFRSDFSVGKGFWPPVIIRRRNVRRRSSKMKTDI